MSAWKEWTQEDWQRAVYCDTCGLPLLEEGEGIGHYICVYCNWTNDEKDVIASKDETIRKLREALLPFANISKHFDSKFGNRPKADDDPVAFWGSEKQEDGFTVGDLRRAKKICDETEKS